MRSVCLLVLCVVSLAPAARGEENPPVPERYKSIYEQLDAKLNEAEAYVRQHPAKDDAPITIGAQLLPADANRGPVILQPRIAQGVDVYLNTMKRLGVSSVKVQISYPCINPDYANSDQYLAFFVRTTKAAHDRGLKVQVQATSAFHDPTYGHLPYDPKGLTLERYMEEKRAMIEKIINEVHPDLLTLENEPDSQARNTGLELNGPNFIKLIEHELSGLDRKGVLVGAGAGTWSPIGMFDAIAQTKVDYLDAHIYPINGAMLLPKLQQISETARKHQKQWIIGEAWLYKTDGRDGYGDYQAIYKRDAYSFWAPLDSRFITMLPKLARSLGAQQVNFFWINYCFGMVNYSPELEALSTQEMLLRSSQGAAANMVRFNLNTVGESLQKTAEETPAATRRAR